MVSSILEQIQQRGEQLLHRGSEHLQHLQGQREALKQRGEQVVEQGRETVHKLETVVLSQAHELVSKASEVLGDRAPILKQGEERLARLVEQLHAEDAAAEPVEAAADAEEEATEAAPTEIEQEVAAAMAQAVEAQAPLQNEPADAEEEAPEVIAEAVALPIEGYDALTIKKIEPLLADLDEAGLQAVRAYEEANKNRVTVLRLIDERLSPQGELT